MGHGKGERPLFDVEVRTTALSNSGTVELDAKSRVSRFTEKPAVQQRTPGLVNAGIYVLSPSVLEYIPPGYSDFGYDIFPKLLAADQPVLAFEIDNELTAIDTPELYAAARAKT